MCPLLELRVGWPSLKPRNEYIRYGWIPKGSFRCYYPKREWLLSWKINICLRYQNPSVRISSVLPPPTPSGHLYRPWLPPGWSTPIASGYKQPGHPESGSSKYWGLSTPPQLPSKVPLRPQKTLLGFVFHPPQCEAESLTHQAAKHQPWKHFSKSLSLALAYSGTWGHWLDSEIIMFYPSLIPLSVTKTRRDKCSNGRTHSCSICSWLFSASELPYPGTSPGDQPPALLSVSTTLLSKSSLHFPSCILQSRQLPRGLLVPYTWGATICMSPIPCLLCRELAFLPGLRLCVECHSGWL